MKTKTVKTYAVLKRWILWIGLGLWLVSMILLTCCVAADMVLQIDAKLQEYTHLSRRWTSENNTIPGTMERNMIGDLGSAYIWIDIDPLLPIVEDQLLSNKIGSRDWIWGKWELYYGFEPAVIYYDSNRNELIRTGNYLTFDYTSPQNWEAGELTVLGKGYVALDQIPGGAERFDNVITDFPMGDHGMSILLPLLRLTGWFEGNEFHPTMIENGHHYNHQGSVMDVAKLADLDSRGLVEWATMLTDNAPEGKELVTIYAWEPGGYNANPKRVTIHGQTYDSVADVIQKEVESGKAYSMEKRSLWETVLIKYGYHQNSDGEYQMVSAVRCRPLMYAAIRLVWVYIVSFGVIGFVLYRILGTVRRELTEPLEIIAGAIRVGHNITPRSDWAEPAAMEAYFIQTHQALAENKTELTQLRTALEYAQDAEQRRKRLISDITHELKTPLAIIHSYTECLQEGVAPEKREQYLATIQEETERMDALVIQMLELSRLDAGKVRLRAEPVDLTALTKAVAETFAPLMEGKSLTLSYPVAMEFQVLADEGRMHQVITNLLSNAVKYTPEGGEILARVFVSGKTAYLTIANTAPALSAEALDRVFDSFYRGDASRNTPGTGLGLALVKSIVNLHGGTVTVQNVPDETNRNWVEFRVELPLGE